MATGRSHSGAKKRFRISGSGKVRARKTHRTHNFSHKSGARVRRLKKGLTLTPLQSQKLRSIL